MMFDWTILGERVDGKERRARSKLKVCGISEEEAHAYLTVSIAVLVKVASVEHEYHGI